MRCIYLIESLVFAFALLVDKHRAKLAAPGRNGDLDPDEFDHLVESFDEVGERSAMTGGR
jgi:hypothetical protein